MGKEGAYIRQIGLYKETIIPKFLGSMTFGSVAQKLKYYF
jgi:hypothetical protein